jgi:alanyl-tRNA synthetase
VTHRADGIAASDVRSLALDVRGRLQGRPAVVVVVGTADNKPSVVVALNEPAIDRGLAANDLIGVIGEYVGGRGGGKADVAQGGGSLLGGIDAGFAAVRDAVARAV